MSQAAESYDFLVIGGGPAGQKAAVQAAKVGERVLVVERGVVGGECVQRGTIPSKTLRESALHLSGLRARAVGILDELAADTPIKSLMRRLDDVLKGHQDFMSDQLERNGIDVIRGRAKFLSENEVEITKSDGSTRVARAETIIVATGSRPRKPDDIPVDHEHILDSDSILSLIYLPKSLTVMGAGVIACEFATIFQALGVEVTMIDRRSKPLGFLDPEIIGLFLARFKAMGGRFIPDAHTKRVEFDGMAAVEVELESGEVLKSEKALVALGRTASVNGLGLEAAGIELSDRGFIPVDEFCRSSVEHIYAIGDVVGPPALATASMEQGRRAARHALGLETQGRIDLIPVGVYTIPEIASVGLTEAQVVDKGEKPIIGRARFEEIARGQISGERDGLLKLVCDPSGRRLLGAHVIGAGATDLVHLAQLAMIGEMPIDTFVDNIFNFPTMAECYRVAALDVVGRRPKAVPLVG